LNAIEGIAAEPWRHDFFAALRAIEAQHAHLPRLGFAKRPADEPIRLGQHPDMSFAPAAISGIKHNAHGLPPRMELAFFGLFGPNGALPLHLTDHARERILHHADETTARFADVFHHRLGLLFYRAWAQAQPTVSLDRGRDDRFAQFVGSLMGLGVSELQNRDDAPDHSKLYFAGHFARQTRNGCPSSSNHSWATGCSCPCQSARVCKPANTPRASWAVAPWQASRCLTVNTSSGYTSAP
jgi:type VI secretion system protein ImpH